MGKNNLAKLSLEELSEKIGRNTSFVSRLMERGELPCKQKSGKFAVSPDDIETIREKLEADRKEMLDAFNNKGEMRRRVIDELSSDLDYDYNPKTDRIFF
ncbi:MAG: hypothetical protein H9W81_18490 [Enterococcus sp.]|nr:hypothetical protein [Enterococcus sp.]